ncbi:hypothetical protein [Isoptericola haloaureus]|uniref:Uncharacterized protein n=1 Tax=Isoptericola haloaureus TaxID=1542902 RepID=A0ABU7Z750_9MICO
MRTSTSHRWTATAVPTVALAVVASSVGVPGAWATPDDGGPTVIDVDVITPRPGFGGTGPGDVVVRLEADDPWHPGTEEITLTLVEGRDTTAPVIWTDGAPGTCAAARPTGYRPPWEHTLGNPWGRFPQD